MSTNPIGILGAPLETSIFNPADGTFLVTGTISWFAADKTTPQPVYTTPDTNPGTRYPNPYILDSIASQPPMYYLAGTTYWIEIRPAPAPGCDCMAVAPIYSFYYYPPAAPLNPDSSSIEVYNFLTDGQFQYPVVFNTLEETTGQLNVNAVTTIDQNWTVTLNSSDSDDIVTAAFQNVEDQALPGNPYNLLQLQVVVNNGISVISLDQSLGPVNSLAGEAVTFSILGNSNTGSNVIVELLGTYTYGPGQISTVQLGTISIGTLQQLYSTTFTMPVLENFTIDNYTNNLNFSLSLPIVGLPDISITNLQLEKGTAITPKYIQQPYAVTQAKSIGQAFIMPTSNDSEKGESEWDTCKFVNNQYQFYNNSGQLYAPVFTGSVPPDMLIVTGQVLKVSGYTGTIPNRRLYDVIGDTFGGAGDLVATSVKNVVTAGSALGGVQNSNWTSGTASATLTVVLSQVGLPLGINAAITGTNQVTATFENFFAPNQSASGIPSVGEIPASVIGSWYQFQGASGNPDGNSAITSTTITPGNNVDEYASALLTFTTPVFNSSNYSTSYGVVPGIGGFRYGLNLLEFATVGNNTRGTYTRNSTNPEYSPIAVLFSVDGVINNGLPALGTQTTVTVPFNSSASLQRNMMTFIKTIAPPFQYTITVNALPVHSTYFLASSPKNAPVPLDYYVWFKVEGVGTDPMVPDRTGIEVDLLAADTTTEAAAKIATALDSQTFTLPTQADLIALESDFIKWAIFI